MAYSDIMNQDALSLPVGSAIYEKGFADNFSSSLSSAVIGLPMMSDYLKSIQHADRNKVFTERFGTDFSGDAKKNIVKGDLEDGDIYLTRVEAEQRRLMDADIISRRSASPDSVAGLKTTDEINSLVVSARQNADIDAARDFDARSSNFAGYGGMIAGSVVGAMTDPVNAVSLLVGATPAMSFGRAVLFEGGLNAGIEALQTPENKRWAEEVGYQYGLGEAAFNIATAGAGGAGITAVMRGGGKVLSMIRGKSAEILDKAGSNRNIPNAQRDAAKYQSLTAHMDEGTPLERVVATAEEVAINRKNLREMQDAIEQGREPNIDESVFTDKIARDIDPEAFSILGSVRSQIDTLRRGVDNLLTEKIAPDASSAEVVAANKRIADLEAKLEKTEGNRKKANISKQIADAKKDADATLAARTSQQSDQVQALREGILDLQRQAADAAVRANKARNLAKEQLPSEIVKMQGVSQRYKDAQNLVNMNRIRELEAQITKKPQKASIYQAQIDKIRAEMSRAPEMLAPVAEMPRKQTKKANKEKPSEDLTPDDIERLINEVDPRPVREQPIIDDMGRTDTADPMQQIQESVPTREKAVEAFNVDMTEFQRVLNANPDRKILVPGEGDGEFVSISVRDIAALMDEDEAVVKAVTFCGIGK